MKYLFIAAIALLSLQSCKDFIATNISGKSPVLILPQSLDTIGTNPVQFKWDKMDGATKYRLQIATPSFSNITAYVLDTIISTTEFTMTLDTLAYELNLTAMNAGYTSNTLGPVKFWVGTTSSGPVTTTSVVLTSPVAASYKNAAFNRSFSWNGITGGTGYSFVLVKGTSFSGGQQIYASPLPALNTSQIQVPAANFPFDNDQYFWGVKAWTASGDLPYVTGSFFIDTIVPATPTFTSPTNNSTTSLASNPGALAFSWTYTPGSGVADSPVRSIIELSLSQTFNTFYKQDTVAVGILTKSYTLPANIYYWRVRNIDDAGNFSLPPVSPAPNYFTLTITP